MAGDLYVRILIKDNKNYERRGADLFIQQKIPLLNALTGVTLEFIHLDGRKFTISTAPGEIISNSKEYLI
jgi:DnaJ-class molecular chaperone